MLTWSLVSACSGPEGAPVMDGMTTGSPQDSADSSSEDSNGSSGAICGDGICETGEGMATCLLDCKDPTCGDGIKAGDEACDDGNLADTDACTSDCKAATCGDGLVQVGAEGCDDRNAVDTDACTSACEPARCGDGIVWAGVEDCDDGNEDNTDACTTQCAAPRCGDGLLGPGEACDDGNELQTDSCVNGCEAATCGDGLVESLAEECDDGDQDDEDACRNNCEAARCGDGVVQVGVEACDDGNEADGDACRSDCLEHRVAFVTSATFTGDLGGLNGADLKCQAAAETAKLDNADRFKAWLSDTMEGPVDRFDTKFTGVFELPDNTVVVRAGWSDLTDGNLEHAIDRDESGTTVVSAVWTNTGSDGKLVVGGLNCNTWSNAGALKGNIGLSDEATLDGTWTFGNAQFCSSAARLYCFEN